MPYELAGIEYRTKGLITEAVQELVARVPRGEDLTGADHAFVAALYDVRHPEDVARSFYRSLNVKHLANERFVATEGLSAHSDDSSERWPEGGAFSWKKCIRDLRPIAVVEAALEHQRCLG